MDARDVDEPSELRPPMPSRIGHASAVQPLFATIWPFICILVVRLIASLSVVALAGVTLRRLFSQRKDLQDALAASEERFVGSLSDIQKRRQAEALLFEEKERAQVTLASIADAVVTVDTAGRIEFMNPIAERLTGWPLDEARHRPVAEVFAVVDEANGAPIPDPVARALTDDATTE